jgi:cytochrome c-type biogenesis protein
MRTRNLLLLALLVLSLVAAALALGPATSNRNAGLTTSSTAPGFTLTDIYGHPFNLSSTSSTDVVVIEFTALSCSECQIVEKSLASLYANYNQSGTTSVRIVSVYIEPSFGDTISALRAYHTKNNITWTMAQDTSSLAVSTAYGVNAIPDVVVVDKHQNVVYDVSGVQDDSALKSTIASANAGTAKAIALVTVSVFALAAVAGVTTFFSPCAFPMFPGYMSLFLGLNAGGAAAPPPGSATYKGTARRALFAGSVTAAGMIVVFLIIGVALIYAASLVGGYIPYLLIVVGVILVGLGVLLLTNLQYWKIVTPLQRLWARVRGQKPAGAEVPAIGASGKGFYVKLFSYGTGYAAAAAGCVAPVIFSAIIAGLALGLLGGLISILIYSLTAALLMIVVTVMLAVAGKKYMNQLKAFTPVIKKISAGVLIVVGFYLIYFFYTAWGF